jgi:hypothetical protein
VAAAANGNSLFGYVVGENWFPQPKEAAGVLGRTTAWIYDTFGEHRRSGFYYVLAALLLAVPLWWRSRAARFSVVFFAVGWLAMALTRDAGGSAHHVILLWPFPILFAVAALNRIPWRIVPVLITTGVVVMNLLVINQHIYQFKRFGAGDTFTDAIFPLSEQLKGRESATVYITDWGIFDSLNLLHKGRLNLRIVSGAFSTDTPNEFERRDIDSTLQDPTALIVGHVREREIFPNISLHLDQEIQNRGLRKTDVQVIADTNGRPVFEVFRIQPH